MLLGSIRGAIRHLVVLGILLGAATRQAPAQISPNLKMGNPSQATADISQANNYLLDRNYFVTSYNNANGTPNWVSWRLAKADLGRAPRDNFYAATDLPEGLLAVDPSAYNGSGFDRGHMCPHGDRTATDQASLATFCMVNIIPQSHDVNTMAWESLENYCRSLVTTQGKTCYILDGPSGQGGTGKDGFRTMTPAGPVVVPSKNWKVVMVLDNDVAAAQDLTATSAIRLIAVIMPNVDGAVGEDWTPFRTSVSAVEALTGYSFFSNVDPAVINPLKGQVDSEPVSPETPGIRGQFDTIVAVQSATPLPPLPSQAGEPMMRESADPALTKATRGLTYPSETDEPVQAFSWGKVQGPLDDEKLRTLTHQDPRARVEHVEVAAFFKRLIEPKTARSQVSTEDAQRFAILFQTLKSQLSSLEVVKFGLSEISIYIFGRTKDGRIIGVKTGATET